jgi:hypothetical protein
MHHADVAPQHALCAQHYLLLLLLPRRRRRRRSLPRRGRRAGAVCGGAGPAAGRRQRGAAAKAGGARAAGERLTQAPLSVTGLGRRRVRPWGGGGPWQMGGAAEVRWNGPFQAPHKARQEV